MLNEQDRIVPLLEECRGPGIERIVVDGGSRDQTAERARRAGALVISEKPGRARQLEAGRRAAKGEAVLFLHADTALPAGWSRALREALADPAVAGGAYRLSFESERPGMRLVAGGARLRARWLGLPYGDQALFARREVLEASGGIADVPIFEDLDLARTIRTAGRLVLLPLPVQSSARRYEANGISRTVARNALALLAWGLGVDRAAVARWYRGRPRR